MELLSEKGGVFSSNDPYISRLVPDGNYSYNMKKYELFAVTLAAAECVLMATDHSG